MKIKMEVDDNFEDDEIIIRCRSLTEDILLLQKKIADTVNTKMQLNVYKGTTLYYLSLDEILFLETQENIVMVHTCNSIYESKQRLYELEELLPRNFMRVAKSTILNTNSIRAIHKNITGASEVELSNTNKIVYVSRNYVKALKNVLDEKRLKKKKKISQ